MLRAKCGIPWGYKQNKANMDTFAVAFFNVRVIDNKRRYRLSHIINLFM